MDTKPSPLTWYVAGGVCSYQMGTLPVGYDFYMWSALTGLCFVVGFLLDFIYEAERP
jgi:hypothetical protein